MSLHTPRVFAPTGTRIRAFIGDTVVADSTQAALLRTSPFKIVYGFPECDVTSGALERSERVEDPDTEGYVFIGFNAVDRWFEEDVELIRAYPEPLQDAERVKGCVCFYHEKMQVTIDGEAQKRPPKYFTK